MANRNFTKTLKMFQNIITRSARGFSSLSYLCFILTYFRISRSCSQFCNKKKALKDFANFTKKSLLESLFNKLHANSIKIESRYRCLSLIFVKFLRTVFYRTTGNSCFWSLSGVMKNKF